MQDESEISSKKLDLPARSWSQRYALLLFLILALIIAWVFWIPMAMLGPIITENFFLSLLVQSLGALSVLISLFILEKVTKKQVNADQIFNLIRLNKKAIFWLILATFIFILPKIAANFLNTVAGYEPYFIIFIEELWMTLGLGVIPTMIALLLAGLLSSPFLEEPGWRGYALSELRSRLGREGGSLLLGSYWWLWHIPIYITYRLDMGIYSLVEMVLYSFIIDSLFILSKKNLLVAMMAHSSLRVAITYFYSSQTNLFLPIIFLGVVIIMRLVEWKQMK